MSIAHLTDTQLQQICALLISRDDDVHRQGLELLETLAPAGPDAMRGVYLADIGLDHPDLSGRDLAGARFRGVGRGRQMPGTLHGACLIGAQIDTYWSPRTDLSGADLRYSRLSPRYHEVRVSWKVPKLAGADLRGVNLSRADFRGGRFSGLDLSGANLSGANLRGANLKGTRLVGADLTGAELFRVNLKGADLTGAAMTFTNTIRWDAATRFPAGQAPRPGERPSRVLPRYGARGT